MLKPQLAEFMRRMDPKSVAIIPGDEDMAERVTTGHAEQEADERHGERQGDRAFGRQLHRRRDRQHDDVGGDDEPAGSE